MRMFFILVITSIAASVSFFASADNLRGLSVSTSSTPAGAESGHPRCPRKIAVGPDGTDVACLMLKRKGR
jgi:hypothetical protein